MNRIILKKLAVSGENKDDAILEFQMGLNLITGDSDNGKTYIFQCLNYILGAKMPPKEISEAKGYQKISLLFSINGKDYLLERIIGDSKIVVKYEGKVESLASNHDPVNNNNLSKFILNLLLESSENIEVKKNAQNGKRTLSFRDLVHLCMIDETEIIAEKSAFQSDQYTETTVRSSIFKFIVSGKDDSDTITISSNGDEVIRRAGVVQFLESKKLSLLKKIDEIEKNHQYKLYNSSKTLQEMILKINTLRNNISRINGECMEKEKTLADLKKQCFSDEVKILNFKSVYSHYIDKMKKNETMGTYVDFLTQIPKLDCPICGKTFGSEVNFCEEESKDLFDYFDLESQTLIKKVEGIEETLIDINSRLSENQEEIRRLQNEIDVSKQQVKSLQEELGELNKNIVIIRQLDSMQKTLEIYRQELKEVERDIVAYGEKIKKNKKLEDNIDLTVYDSYCEKVDKIFKQWGLGMSSEIIFDPKQLDIIVGEKKRISWGKGYRACTMAAMAIALMRHCYDNSLLHPGFVILDSPLVSLKERKRDANNEWISDYIEQKMIEDIYTEDCLHQVIIFENKDLKYNLDFNYVEFTHEGVGRSGFIPKQP